MAMMTEHKKAACFPFNQVPPTQQQFISLLSWLVIRLFMRSEVGQSVTIQRKHADTKKVPWSL